MNSIPFATLYLATQNLHGFTLLTAVCIIVAFLICWMFNRYSLRRIRKNSRRISDLSVIMKHTLNQNGNYVIRLSLDTMKATNIHGSFIPNEGVTLEEGMQYIHPDDRKGYIAFLRQFTQGVHSTEYTFRWNVSKTPDSPQWRYYRDRGIAEFGNHNSQMPTNIFCTINDITDSIRQEKDEHMLTDKYRKVFEQSIVGLAFFDKEGNLLTTNRKLREILKFQSEDDPYYYTRTIYDMPTFRELLDSRHLEELWVCGKSVLPERGVNCYTELRVHPIFDDKQELIYITFSIRDVTQERELYLQNKRNDTIIRQHNEEIQQYENELQYLMENCNMRFWRSSFDRHEVTFFKGLRHPEKVMTFEEFTAQIVNCTDNIREHFSHPEIYFTEPKAYVCQTYPIFHESAEPQWNYIDCVPYYDEKGRTLGCYGILRNVNELIMKQERLKQETERANDSGRMKSAFMANMTHEIRTPLNSIVGFSDVLPMMESKEEKAEIIKVIMNNCDMLMRLINDILAVSTLDSTGITIEPAEVDFAQSFNALCDTLAQRVDNPAITFLTEKPFDSFLTMLDIGRVEQVITNFVTNAVKYTREGHIKLGYDYRDEGLYIYCEDTGSGVPKDAQTKVFERFVKLNDYIQGTGLGLSICKAIIDRCNGKIGVNSEGEGKGSTFWIWIPCKKIE